MRYMTLNILGQDFPVLETVVKPKPGQQLDPTKTYFTFRLPTSATGAFGQPIKALDTELPTQVTLDGVPVYLLPGLTAAEYTDRTTKQKVTIPESDRRPLVAFNGLQTFPSLAKDGDTGVRTVQVTISVTSAGVWNLKVVVRKAVESLSPEEQAAARKAAAERKADDAMATFTAFFAAQKAATVPTPADVAPVKA